MKPGKVVCLMIAVAIAAAVAPSLVAAQQSQPGSTSTAASAGARASDVASRDAIVAALYDSISGTPGERDWTRFRALFIPEAQLIATFKKKDGTIGYKSMTPQGYADQAGKYFKEHGFFEREISRKVESYGSIAHISAPTNREKRRTESRSNAGSTAFNCSMMDHDGGLWTCTGPEKRRTTRSQSGT